MEPFYECVHHLDPQHLRTFYDYVDILRNGTKAHVARLLEWTTNEAGAQWKRRAHEAVRLGEPLEPKPELWITLSHKWFLDHIVPRIHEDTLRKHLGEMERDEWVFVRPHPDLNRRHLAPQYLFNSPKMQEAFVLREERKKQAIRKDGRRALSPYIEDFPLYDESKASISPSSVQFRGGKTPTPSENIEGVGKHRGGKTPTPSENIEGVGKGVPGMKTPTRGVGNVQPGGYENTNQGGMKTPTRGVGKGVPRNKNLYSNYGNDSDSNSSSSESPTNNGDVRNATQEEGEDTLFSSISQTDGAEPTEARVPIVARNGGVTQESGQFTPTIPHRPTGVPPSVGAGDESATPAKQARCDALAGKIRELRGGYTLQNGATAQQQAEAIRQLVTQYSDEDIAWIRHYTTHFSEQYRGVKPGPTYATILLEVAPSALAAAAPEVRTILMQQVAVSPVSEQGPLQKMQVRQPPSDNPYSLAALAARQNENGRQS